MRDEIEAAATFLTRLVNKNIAALPNSTTSTPPASDSSSTSSSTSPPLTTSSYDGSTSGAEVDRVEQFRQCLTQALYERFHNHWFPDQPTKGQAYRCIRLNECDRYDPILKSTCLQCGIDYKDLQLPPELTLWVDPDEVTCRFGEHTGSHCLVAKFDHGEVKENNIDRINIETEYDEQTTTSITTKVAVVSATNATTYHHQYQQHQQQHQHHDYRNSHRYIMEDEIYARLPEMCNKKLDILGQDDFGYVPSLPKYLYEKKIRDHQNGLL